ncbi:MAG: thioredoxin-dependent thiol peroxidase [Chloroflexota bacterium]|nr:MAG: thioredoxin-dependent thiol peroxidase [Chloroflexota bacterium]
MPISAGQQAPDFTLTDQDGEDRSLSDYRGTPVVLYFYPKDDTPGCTKQACGFRDDYSAYQEAGVTVLGVSPDNSKSHTKFINKYELPFTLLADTDRKVINLYEVWGLKKSFGREYEGVIRTTYLIDGDGNIAKVFENVAAAKHSKEILSALEELR